MKKINLDVLYKGDIILTTSNEKVSALVRASTQSDISHAMIYVAGGSAMDSTGDGVHSRNLEKLFYEDDCSIYVLRLIDPIDDAKMKSVVTYVRGSTGTPYSAKEAASSVFNTQKAGSKKQFCSRLVARAYASVGVRLCENPDYCSPQNLKESPLLQFVENCTIPVSEFEIEAVEANGNATIGMAEVTNNVLTLARQVCPEILSLNDTIDVAINQPALDAALAEAYRKSGYLEYWKVDENKHPWRYSIGKMFAMQRRLESSGDLDVLVKYCNRTLKHHNEGVFEHWHVNAKRSAELARDFPRETLTLLARLNQQLVEQDKKRIFVAQAWKHVTGL